MEMMRTATKTVLNRRRNSAMCAVRWRLLFPDRDLENRRARLVLLAAIAVGLIATTPASAQNVFFLPGDAFFSTGIRSDRLETLVAGEHEFYYVISPKQTPAFGTYVGVLRLKLQVTEGHLAGLKEACSKVEEFDPPIVQLLENRTQRLNSPRMFIYPDSMREQIRHVPMFLKFNENWMDQAEPLGVQEFTKGDLVEFMPTKIEDSWRYSKRVPALPIENLREAGLRFRALEGRLGPNWIGVVCSHRDFEKYVDGEGLFDLTAYIVSKDGVTEVYIREGWVQRERPDE